jgi:hypothetical protein
LLEDIAQKQRWNSCAGIHLAPRATGVQKWTPIVKNAGVQAN